MNENDTFSLDIKRMGINGEGIGFYNKLAVFVDGAIPGEVHEVCVTNCSQTKMAFAKTVEIKRVSKSRKIAECPYYEACGGCAVMHVKYEDMLINKRNILIEALNRYTSLDTRSFEIKPTVASSDVFGYRNKSQLPVKRYDNKTSVCMIKAKSNQLVPVESCMVNNPLINTLNTQILQLVDEIGLQVYLPKFNRGVLKYLVIRVNKQNEALVTFICHEKNNKIKELAKKVIALSGVKGVYENFNEQIKPGSLFGKETNLLEGEPYIIETLGKVKYQIYPTTFFQLNTKQAEAMYNVVLKACKLSLKERILDGIEYNKESVMAAEENAKINKIKNAKFYQGDASELLPKMIRDGEVFDIVVADPPRTGLGEKFINTLLDSEVKKIIYVSCNPATLAKDLELLRVKYNVNSITPVDMFPQTPLVETVALLTLNPSVKK